MTAPLATRILPAGAASPAEAARMLGAGGLVAFPTETVYGLGADATNGRAVASSATGQAAALGSTSVSGPGHSAAARASKTARACSAPRAGGGTRR